MSSPPVPRVPSRSSRLEIFRALDRYFEVRRSEVEESIERAGTEFNKFQEARRQLMEAEQELEQIRHRTADLKGEALNNIVEGSEASELEEGTLGWRRSSASRLRSSRAPWAYEGCRKKDSSA